MSLHRKYFIHYCRVSVSEGLPTELPTNQLMLRKFDENVFETCGFCHCTIEIRKSFYSRSQHLQLLLRTFSKRR